MKTTQIFLQLYIEYISELLKTAKDIASKFQDVLNLQQFSLSVFGRCSRTKIVAGCTLNQRYFSNSLLHF